MCSRMCAQSIEASQQHQFELGMIVAAVLPDDSVQVTYKQMNEMNEANHNITWMAWMA